MLFEKASRLKLRFQSPKGPIGIEDLWDLSLANLNLLAKELYRKNKESAEIDFLQEVSKEDELTKLRFDVVMYVLETKKGEQKARETEAARKAEKEKILGVIAKKQDEALENLSLDELKAKAAAL